LNVFYVIGSAKQKTTNVLGTSKTKEQSRECRKRKSDTLSQILSLDPLYFQELYLAHFSFILNNFKGYKCAISKCIKLVLNNNNNKIVEELKLQNHTKHL
jgi:hypothetical protein